MSGAPFLVSTHIKDASEMLVDWIEEHKTTEGFPFSKDISSAITDSLQKLQTYPSILPKENPLVRVTYEYDSDYGEFTDTSITTLKDYVLISLANPTFYYYDRVGKNSEVNATPVDFDIEWVTDEEDAPDDLEKWSWEHNEYLPSYNEDFKDEIWELLTIEDDGTIPDFEDYRELFEKTLAKYPRSVCLELVNAVKFVQVEYWISRRTTLHDVTMDAWLHFDDARAAALFVASKPIVEYTPPSYQRPKEGTVCLLDMSKPYVINVDYESDTQCGNFTWTPEQDQLDRMYKECEPREDWHDMMAYAQEIAANKKSKKDSLLCYSPQLQSRSSARRSSSCLHALFDCGCDYTR